MQTTATADSLRLLLSRAVDYAGLFPPASLGMREAVANYSAYRAGLHAWMLGRFIVPVARLNEFATAAANVLPHQTESHPWVLSALSADNVVTDARQIAGFNERYEGRALIDVCELRVRSAAELAAVAASLPGPLQYFFEIPLQADVNAMASAAAASGVGIKARTGGTTGDAFPRTKDLVRFLRAAVEHHVPFKLTAGLHHPLPGEYRLTYEADAPRGAMFGFLTVFLAAALIRAGGLDEQARELLGETDAGSLRFEGQAVVWNGFVIRAEDIAAVRRQLIGFGSCSFAEPVDELGALGLLA